MDIAYLSDIRIPSKAASVVHVLKMCESLARLGHRVTLFYADGDPDLNNVFRQYGVTERYSGVSISRSKIRGVAYWYSLKIAWLARKRNVDLAVSRNVAACAACAVLGVPVVLEAHMPTREKGLVSHVLVKLLGVLANVRGLVVISQALERYFKETYGWKKKLVVIPDAAPAKSVVPSEMRTLSGIRKDGKLNIGYTGHLYEGRGIDLLVDIAVRCGWVHIHVVGGEPEDVAEWKFRCRNLDNITFYGHVDYTMTEVYRAACDVLAAPYQGEVKVSGGKWNTAKWMSPLKVFEYMSSGRAIISSDLPVLREVLRDGENSVLCSCSNVEEWIDALEELNRKPEYREKLARTAYREYEEKYTWDKRAERLIKAMC